jgi:hypothetical protein
MRLTKFDFSTEMQAQASKQKNTLGLINEIS